jgi:FGGY-family pentulose kinase
LSDVAADELGLGAGTPVSASLIDAHAGALGTLAVGSIDAPLVRRLAVIAGTSACHLAISREQVAVPGVWGPYYEALIPDHWLLEAGISASGAFLDHVLQSHPAAAGEENLFDLLEARVSALTANGGSIEQLTDDLHFQCNVLGNRAPLADPTLAGGLSGWRLRSDLNELARWYVAALQSLAYATRHIVDEFVAQGAPLQVLVASGGSANNARWRQTHADALGLPVAVPRGVDGVLLGSAMLGAAAAGVHPSLEAAMHAMAPDGDVVMPDAATRSFHDRKYRVYREMIQDQLGYAAIMRGDLK